jgi:polyhydroxyalkanoate synthesis repressor PhaR
MRIIKRYPNRKLYDTEEKQYITLNGITDLIRTGSEVQVIDHASGQDLTAVTLTQIIFEEEKKQSGLLPNSLLTGLIRASGNRLSSIQRTIFSSTFWHQIDDEIKQRIKTLTKLGELTEEEGKKLLEKLLRPDLKNHYTGTEKSKTTETLSDQDLVDYLNKRQIPTQADLQSLSDQIEKLAAKINQIASSESNS